MGLFDIFKKKTEVTTASKSNVVEPTLMDDIPVAADWIVAALNSSGYVVDYSLESLKEVDRFFDEQSGPDGILQRHGVGRILFAIASYVGQVAIKCCAGHIWVPLARTTSILISPCGSVSSVTQCPPQHFIATCPT